MEFELPPNFWPTIFRLSTGQSWPPQNDDQAERFIARVVPEGLLSLLLAAPSLPPAVEIAARKLQALDRTNRLRTHVFEQSLRAVLDVLGGERIIVLKGMDYAYRLYPAPHLRPRQDIDVLVQRERSASIIAKLKEASFKQHFIAGSVGRVAAYHEAVFEVGNATVEVHHSFVQRARNRVDYAEIWERAKVWSGFDERLLRLDDADGLVYHAINMSSDQFSSPIFRHLDIWLMLRDRLDILPAAVSRARVWATSRALYGALRQTSRYFPDFQTPQVEAAMTELLPARTRAFLDRRILIDPWLPRRRYGRAGQLWRKFWLIDDTAHRASFAMYHAYALIAGKVLELREERASL
ncbi:MAG: nucleotidyltransferase family protein [Acidobacteriota bacterium]|nr:nucleotidyltransferase family protein [Acidobacteriota bacterium]